MATKDILTELCDKMEKCCKEKHCFKNEIVCTKKFLVEYIGNDKNKILQLRALIKYHDENKMSFIDFITKIVTVCSFMLVILYNVVKDTENIYLYIETSIIYIFIILSISLVDIFTSRLETPRKKWRRFIEIVLDELELNQDQ